MVDTLRHRPHNRPDIAIWNDTGDAFRILRQTDRDAEPDYDFATEVRELRAEWIQFEEPERLGKYIFRFRLSSADAAQ